MNSMKYKILRDQTTESPWAGLVPSGFELGVLADQAFTDWARLSAEPAWEEPFPGPNQLTLERRVRFSGWLEGELVMRCSHDLAIKLAGVPWSNPWAQERGEAAFEGLAALYSRRLLRQMIARGSQGQAASDPQPSRPCDWPQAQADSCCLVMVSGLPFEIRFWLRKLETAIFEEALA